MKQDRFLIGILVGIGVLVVAAFVLFFMRQSQMNYVADDTPAGTVQDYVLALHKGDYEKAYGYLAAGQDKPNYDDFRKPFVTKMISISTADVQIRDTTLLNQEAVVSLVFSNYYDGPYNSSNTNEQATLKMENGHWKISAMPQPYWFYDWYQPKYPPQNGAIPAETHPPTPTTRPITDPSLTLTPALPPTPTAQ